ncbi:MULTISPECIES: OprO/OprP family phosphate-selective porin [unclassified Myxococcus]|uniref:OprO/OprP family phosphate-selective porin n=1 Tax=unclassified Myxococcus TaxID=2648731 RepID=UPI001CC0C892|nr:MULTISPECIES: porin [unclassified Myxococcus]MBZ4401918.1 OprO/OprP family phosphate-selective porin [Myxococcus sp. AS-1-15]MBZ4407275.1 OprO/OprP family phosphate-selective porin [Myxococcus sp. XM-1-1-1]
MAGPPPHRCTPLLAVALSWLCSSVALAQTPPPAEPTPPAPGSVSVRATSEGISLHSADNALLLKLRGYVQLDGRFFESRADRPGATTLLIRRARPLLEGTLFSLFDFRLLVDFAANVPPLWDAYLEFRPRKEVRVRVGRFRPPVGLERNQSGIHTLFIERALPTDLVPNRDVGVMVHGELKDGVVSYALGAFNGTADGASADTNLDDSFDLAARVFAHPFRALGLSSLSGLGLGIAASRGSQFGSASTTGEAPLRSMGQQTFFIFRTGNGLGETVVAHGPHVRWSPQGYLYLGPLGAMAEYVSSTQEVHLGEQHARLRFESWQASASYVLFGGKAAYDGVKPTEPFGASADGWGAVEVGARMSELRVDPDAFPVYADPTRAARKAHGWGAVANWYLNNNVRVATSYDHTEYEGGAVDGARLPESVVMSRFQVSW